jgi:hypothetical protein
MAILVNCCECGGSVSSDADRCPHCGCNPIPYPCRKCGKPVKPSEAKEFMHPKCAIDRRQEIDLTDAFTCPACHTVHTLSTFVFKGGAGMEGMSYIESWQRCPKCGHQLLAHKCGYCGRGLFDGTGVTKSSSSGFSYFHTACFPDAVTKGYYKEETKKTSCYLVTATFGRRSRELILVHRRCRYVFLLNPLLTIGWCLYRFYGPLLARWAQASSVGYAVCKKAIAVPIVAASGRNPVAAVAAMAYLAFLSMVGLVCFVPAYIYASQPIPALRWKTIFSPGNGFVPDCHDGKGISC